MSLSLNANMNVNLTAEELLDFQTPPPPPTPELRSSHSLSISQPTPPLSADMNDVRYSSVTPIPPLEEVSPLPLSLPLMRYFIDTCTCTIDSSEGCLLHQKNRTLFYIPETGEYLHPRLH